MWKHTSASQAKYYNSKHVEKYYNAGDKIYLNARNIRTRRPSKKLDYKYYDPYTIDKSVGKNAYRLLLSANMNSIHDVFHVSLLEPFREGREAAEPPPIELDGEDQWEIEEVLNSRIHHRKLQYYVRWLGYPDTDNQWLPESEIGNAREVVEAFHEKYPSKPQKGERSVKRRRRVWRQALIWVFIGGTLFPDFFPKGFLSGFNEIHHEIPSHRVLNVTAQEPRHITKDKTNMQFY